jgi:hypothetical protein
MASLRSANAIDMDDWRRRELTDGPFVYENGKRATWPVDQWTDVTLGMGRTYSVAFPVDEYQWEGHLDATLPEGKSCKLLAAWIMQLAHLTLDPLSDDIIRDEHDQIVAFDVRSERGNPKSIGLLVRASWFRSFLEQHNLDCVWLLQGEKAAWNDGDEEAARTYRVFNGVKLLSNGLSTQVTWEKDQRRAEAA